MDNKAQLFTLDLLLALVPLAVVIGMSANAIAGVTTQMQEYSYSYGMQRIANDAADALVKTAGMPPEWDNASVQTLGFAVYMGDVGCPVPKSNVTINNILDNAKLSTFSNSFNTAAISSALKNIAGGNNIRILVTNSTATLIDIAGYTSSGAWLTTDNATTINALLSNASNVMVAERVVGIVDLAATGLIFSTIYTPNATEGAEAINLKSTPAVGNLDGSGTREIVVTGDNYVYAMYSNGSSMWTYTNTSDEFKHSSPALGDLTGDGNPEVIVGSKNGVIYAVRSTGTLYWSYRISNGDDIYSTPALADLNSDGDLEIIIGDEDSTNLTVLNPDGSLYWSRSLGKGTKSSPAVANIDSDGYYEIVIGNEGNEIAALNHDGSTVSGFPYTTGGHVHSSPAIGDIDGDGSMEIVVGSDDKYVYVLNSTGALKWRAQVGDEISSSPALADLDEDGKLEIIFGSEDKKIYAYNSDGTKIWDYSTSDEIKWSSPGVGDIDGDCKLEVVIGSTDKKLYALNHDGSLLWSYTAGAKIQSSPVIVDLDSDGYLEIVVTSDDGNVHVINTPGAGVEWPTFKQCWKRAGYFYDSSCGGTTTTSTINIAADSTEGGLKVFIWR